MYVDQRWAIIFPGRTWNSDGCQGSHKFLPLCAFMKYRKHTAHSLLFLSIYYVKTKSCTHQTKAVLGHYPSCTPVGIFDKTVVWPTSPVVCVWLFYISVVVGCLKYPEEWKHSTDNNIYTQFWNQSVLYAVVMVNVFLLWTRCELAQSSPWCPRSTPCVALLGMTWWLILLHV